MNALSEGNWKRRKDLVGGSVVDAWYAKDWGIAVKTRLGWWAGNGHCVPIMALSDKPELLKPRVGPFANVEEAVAMYANAIREGRHGSIR